MTYVSNGEAAEAPGTIDFGEILTDAKGEIRLHEQGKRLYPREYTITEVRPAPGFQMKEPSTQKIILHGSESKTVTFENVPLNAIIVEKYDSVTHEALPGCTFQLRYLGGTLWHWRDRHRPESHREKRDRHLDWAEKRHLHSGGGGPGRWVLYHPVLRDDFPGRQR